MSCRIAVALALVLALPFAAAAQNQSPFFANSYALVIGIDTYDDTSFERLNYAVKDAEGIAAFLEQQGFEVIDLYTRRATKAAILAAVEDELIPRLSANDRVLIFFAGHGVTRLLSGDDERGYLVPIDAVSTSFASMIPLTQLRDMSDAMGVVKHQLFILDSCFGGLAALRNAPSIQAIDPRTPDYVFAVTRNKARQLLTAGGPDERVSDGGPNGHSLFTGQLLRALNEGVGDLNSDGYVTFGELFSYIVPAASSYNQTPRQAFFDGHELGEFLFLRPGYEPAATGAAAPANAAPSAPPIDIYATLSAGISAFNARNYAAARPLFQQLADLGNAEAMEYLGKLVWEGLGGAADQELGVRWLVMAAERGRVGAMRNLIRIYESALPRWTNPTEAARWRKALAEAENLQADLEIVDPSGQAGGSPEIPPADTVVRIPMAPMNLTVR